jgi:adenylate kinase
MIIFVGVTGSGKSVQGKLLASTLKSKYFSMGEFLRSHADHAVAEKMKAGDLVNDSQAIEILKQALAEAKPGPHEFVLDGFPRTIEQANWLVNEFKANKVHVAAVLHLIASPRVVTSRLLSRHRPDDNMPTIHKRIDEYNFNISEIVEHLRKGGVKVCEIDAEKAVEDVHAQIMGLLLEK